VPRENPDDFIRYARFDWLATKTGRFLHAIRDDDWTEDHREDMACLWIVIRPVRLACGQAAACVMIPGPFSRMSRPRCTGCCRATGLERGIGSPKNDSACRKMLGLDSG
jgi:hypothetical protein